MIRIVRRLAAAAIGLLTMSGGAAALDGTLLVVNRDGGSISFIDLGLGLEIARLPVGAAIPHEVAVSPDGRLAVTGAYGTAANPGRRLIVMDVAAARITGEIDLGPKSRPHGLAFLGDSRRAVATMEQSDRIALVDVIELRVLGTYPTGARDGHMVRLSPDGRRAYVASRGGAGTLSVIFLEGGRPTVVIPTGAGAEGLAVTPDGAEIWVVNRQAGTISIVSAATLEVVAEIATRPYSRRAAITAAGRVAVTNGTANEPTPQYLRIYDAATRAVRQDIAFRDGAPLTGSFGLLVQGELIFASDGPGRRLLVLEPKAPGTLRVLTGRDVRPDGMAWSPLRVTVLGK